jgi:hypothetical protein
MHNISAQDPYFYIQSSEIRLCSLVIESSNEGMRYVSHILMYFYNTEWLAGKHALVISYRIACLFVVMCTTI